MTYSHCTANEPVPQTRHRGFTLVEVLIAAMILAMGLIGLAAVFPAVISQQRAANNLSQAVTVGASAENMLNTRLSHFREPFQLINGPTPWVRVDAYDHPDDDSIYLRTPYTEKYDMRLPVPDTHLVSGNGRDGLNDPDARVFRVDLPRSPLAYQMLRSVVVTIRLDNALAIRLRPEFPGATKFIAERDLSRISEYEANFINHEEGYIDFNVRIYRSANESIDEIQVDYFWLNDRIVSHADRLSPTENPRYAWEMAIRKGINGQVQYALFIYQFTGPDGESFYPEIPGNNGVPNGKKYGMLREANAVVKYDPGLKKFYIREMDLKLDQALEAGVWLLPVKGIGPVRVRRKINPTNYTQDEGVRWELESPPIMVNSRTGEARPLLNEVAFLYMPLEVMSQPQQGNSPVGWRIKPLLAYVKQVDL